MKKFLISLVITAFICLVFLTCTDKYITTLEDGEELSENSSVPIFLGQNDPNPFYPVTNIPFAVNTPMHVTLKVYSEDWQEVAIVLDRDFTAGVPYIQFVEFYKKDIPSGDYYYVIEGSGITKIRKMQVLK